MLILLFSVLTILLAGVFLVLYFASIRASFRAQRLREEGKRLPSFLDELRSLRNEKFQITLLTVPSAMVTAFTILPILFMILIAFTNFDKNHQPPGNLFTWVGFQNFKDIFLAGSPEILHFRQAAGMDPDMGGICHLHQLYSGNDPCPDDSTKREIKFKKFWRTIFL